MFTMPKPPCRLDADAAAPRAMMLTLRLCFRCLGDTPLRAADADVADDAAADELDAFDEPLIYARADLMPMISGAAAFFITLGYFR